MSTGASQIKVTCSYHPLSNNVKKMQDHLSTVTSDHYFGPLDWNARITRPNFPTIYLHWQYRHYLGEGYNYSKPFKFHQLGQTSNNFQISMISCSKASITGRSAFTCIDAQLVPKTLQCHVKIYIDPKQLSGIISVEQSPTNITRFLVGFMITSADTLQIHFRLECFWRGLGTVAQAKIHREDVTRQDETLTAAEERQWQHQRCCL